MASSQRGANGSSGKETTKKFTGVPTFSTGNYRVNWINSIVVFTPIFLALYGLCTTTWVLNTFAFTLFWYYLTGTGITAGYHRLWAHKAYEASTPVQWALACLGAASYEGSAIWWCRNHRIHHRYIDTDKDPYNATRGFIYTHWGWMVMKQNFDVLGKTDVSDLKSNKILRLQHTYYLPIAFFFGVVLPWVICGLGWGDWRGGLFFAGFLRIVCVHNSTFFVNSLAHSKLFGASQNYADGNTSHDSFVTALLTLGEGYHNFHHEFPSDYRNGIRFYHFDPTKWTIRFLAYVGLVKKLCRAPKNEIDRDQVDMKLKELKSKMTTIDYGPRVEELPFMSWDKIEARCKNGEKLIVIDGFVIDAKKELSLGSGLTHEDKKVVWYDYHPGGKQMLDCYCGKNATTAFEGEIYKHSQTARKMVERMRIARVQGYKEENH